MNFPDAPEGKSGWPWEAPKTAFAGASSLPRISIVTPSYNQGQFLEETIRSVLLQGYPNLEYWVMDGGSSDNSVEIIRKYEPWLAGWVSEKDAGQSDAINKGWNKCTGDYLGFINSDDLLAPMCLYKEVKFLLEHPEVDLLYGDLIIFSKSISKGKVIRLKKYTLRDLLTTDEWIAQQGSLVKREVIEKIGNMDVNFHYNMDFDFFLRVANQFTIDHIPEIVGYFRYHQESKTVSKLHLAGETSIEIYKKFFKNPELSPEILKLKRRTMANSYFVAAVAYYISDRWRGAWTHLWRALKIRPLYIFSPSFMKLALKLFLCTILGGKQNRLFQNLIRAFGEAPLED